MTSDGTLSVFRMASSNDPTSPYWLCECGGGSWVAGPSGSSTFFSWQSRKSKSCSIYTSIQSGSVKVALKKTQSTRHHKGIIDFQQKSSCVAFSNMPCLLPAYILCAFSMLRCLKRSASMRPHCNPPGTKRRQKIRWNLKHPEFFSLECICMALQ